MAATNVWTLPSPALNVEYVPPNGFWVIPANATSFTIDWHALTAGGGGAAVVSVTLINRDVTAGIDRSTLALVGVNGGTFITSNGHNGVNTFAPAFKITAAGGGLPDHCTISLTAYTGTPYPMARVRRGAGYAGVDGTLAFTRRGGTWAMLQESLDRRGAAWSDS